jgi:alpha-ketoglutarate-dependent taurine dioxygenase
MPRFRPLHDTFGAEATGVDIARPLDRDMLAGIEDAWRRSGILLFRDVRMTPEQHIAFTRALGPLHVMEPPEFNLPEHPEVLVVSNVEKDNKPIGMKRAGWGWHSDGEDKALPNAGSFLYAIELPPAGGDTLYADTYAAFSALPNDVRARIMGRRACFSRARFHQVYYPHLPPLTEEQKKARPDVWHPIARRHPKSGWTSLYIGRWAYRVEGMSDAEAGELIEYLRDFATRPEFVYRHRWRVGDALLWDNRCTQHCATPFDDASHRRLMHRTTLEGETPIMADRPVPRPIDTRALRGASQRDGTPV